MHVSLCVERYGSTSECSNCRQIYPSIMCVFRVCRFVSLFISPYVFPFVRCPLWRFALSSLVHLSCTYPSLHHFRNILTSSTRVVSAKKKKEILLIYGALFLLASIRGLVREQVFFSVVKSKNCVFCPRVVLKNGNKAMPGYF